MSTEQPPPPEPEVIDAGKTTGGTETLKPDIIDAGEITGLEMIPSDVRGEIAVHREKKRSDLAFLLVAILAASVVGHYLILVVLHLGGKIPEDLATQLDAVYNVWLPIISGLASSAITFYFAGHRN